jgi:hypothetical protein
MHRERRAFLPHDSAIPGGPRPYMHSRAYRDPGKVPVADVEAVRE